MPLTTLPDVKTFLNVPFNDNSQDSLLNLLIAQTSDFVQEWTGRTFGQQLYTEQYAGNGQQFLPLNQRPVYQYQQTGTLTSGSTSVTGLSSTTNFLVGMPVVGTTYPSGTGIPAATTILQINTPTSITLSQPATSTGLALLSFGITVFLDEGALWGQEPGAFAPTTMLVPGRDYAISVDQPDGSSRSGLLYNNNGYWPEPFTYNVGLISPLLGPPNGNIQVTYTAGYLPIPTPIELATNMLIARLFNAMESGQGIASESFEDYSKNYVGNSVNPGIMSPEITSILARYKNVAVG